MGAVLMLSACGDDVALQDWQHQFGSEAADTSFGVAATPDGGVVISAATESTLGSDNRHSGDRDIFLARYDPSGVEQWSTQFGTDAGDSPLGVSVAPDDTIYVSGFTGGSLATEGAGSADVWIASFDGDGNELWRQQFGGDGWDRGFDVTAFDDGAYVTGYTASVLDPTTDLEGFDGFAARFSSSGSLEWIRQFGTDAADWGQGSSLAPDGGLYVTGYTEGDLAQQSAGDKDAFLLRLSPDGDVVWSHQFGSPALDWPQGVGTAADGGALIAGATEGDLGADLVGERDAFISHIDPDGNLLFTTQIGSPGIDYAFEVRQIADGFVATGSTTGDLAGSEGERDGLLIWLDESGALLAVEQVGSPENDDLTGLAVTEDGQVFFSGSTFGQVSSPNAGNGDLLLGARSGFGDD